MTDTGSISEENWENYGVETAAWSQGNIFSTEEQATLARDRRILLTKFNSFRDKCNGDWKPDWNNLYEDKYSIQFYHYSMEFTIYNSGYIDGFRLFGYFQKREDAEVAIELFGDEIKRLFVEE